jgi:hypothetical protein
MYYLRYSAAWSSCAHLRSGFIRDKCTLRLIGISRVGISSSSPLLLRKLCPLIPQVVQNQHHPGQIGSLVLPSRVQLNDF